MCRCRSVPLSLAVRPHNCHHPIGYSTTSESTHFCCQKFGQPLESVKYHLLFSRLSLSHGEIFNQRQCHWLQIQTRVVLDTSARRDPETRILCIPFSKTANTCLCCFISTWELYLGRHPWKLFVVFQFSNLLKITLMNNYWPWKT